MIGIYNSNLHFYISSYYFFQFDFTNFTVKGICHSTSLNLAMERIMNYKFFMNCIEVGNFDNLGNRIEVESSDNRGYRN